MQAKSVKNAFLATAGAVAAIAGVQAANADTITVEQGNTLSQLALDYNTTVDALAKLNNIENVNLIYAGDSLELPEGSANNAVASNNGISADGTTYTVKAGDSLGVIAEITGVSVENLKAMNGLTSDLILPGQVLKLNAAVETAQVTAAPAAPAVENAAPAQTYVAPAQQQASPAVNYSAPSTVSHVAYNNAGNTYPAGQCTWYAKSVASWAGNNWGNANQWASSAAAQGFRVDGTPAVGSVVVFQPGQGGAGAYGHVGVVTSVNGGQVTITEGNYAGMASHARTINGAGLTYIHNN